MRIKSIMRFIRYLVSFLLILIACTPTYAEVKVDMTAKEVDKIKGNIRIRELVVNDSGRVNGSRSMCIKDEKFYIGDDIILQANPTDDWVVWGVDLKIKILLNRKISATTVMPISSDKKRKINSVNSFLDNCLTGRIFEDEIYCEKRDKFDVTGERIRYYEVVSIDGLHSLQEVYEKLLKDANK